MGLNSTELSIVLEEINEKQVADTVNRAAVLKRLLPTGGEINGRGVNVFAKVTKNPAMKWFGEGGIYPVGGNAGRVKMTANFARLAISSQMTRDVLEGADKKAIVNVISEEVTGDAITATQELSQQLYGDASGVKAIVASVSGTNVTFRVGVGDLTPDVANYGNTYGTSLLLKNGRYNFISGDGATDRNAGTAGGVVAVGTVLTAAATSDVCTVSSITSGSVAAFNAVPDSAFALIDGDMIVFEGSYGISVNGLNYHIDSGTGTYQNVSRNTYDTLRSYVLNAANSALTVAMLYKLIFQAKFLRNQSILDEDYIILSAPTQVHQYALMANISTAGYNGSAAGTALNTMPNGGKLDYGFRTFEFAGMRWIEDPQCPPHQIFVILPSMYKLHEFKPLSAVPLGGDSGFAPVPAFTSAGVGAYSDNAVYTMTWKGQLVTNDPAKAGMKITNLATTGLALPTSGYALS
jgi:hypothetical protein